MKINNKFITPCATKKDLNGSIVVYAEMIPGNPLKVKNVVRWFLHQPGNRTGSINYKETDLIFYYREQFNVYRYDKKYMLDLIYIKDDIYVNEGRKRNGTCYILRKGEGRELKHDADCSILIDDLSSDTEIAEVFKSTERCISYDSYTMLSKYAAMCGCISIVVPVNGISKEIWRPRLEDRYGIAYGFNDIQWALDTMKMVKNDFLKRKALTIVNVEKFIEITNFHFN